MSISTTQYKWQQSIKQILALFMLSIAMIGCNNLGKSTAQTDAEQSEQVFIGCYSIYKDSAPQIKISEQAGSYVMQMREDPESTALWDTPEPLESIDMKQVPNYFSIETDKVTALIGRPDRLFVLAHVMPEYVNVLPRLDSAYLGYVYQGANTVFKVECI